MTEAKTSLKRTLIGKVVSDKRATKLATQAACACGVWVARFKTEH